MGRFKMPYKLNINLLAIVRTTEYLEQSCLAKGKPADQSDYERLAKMKEQISKIEKLAAEIVIPANILIYGYASLAVYPDGSYSKTYNSYEDYLHDLLNDYMCAIGSKTAYAVHMAAGEGVEIFDGKYWDATKRTLGTVVYKEAELAFILDKLKKWIISNGGSLPIGGGTTQISIIESTDKVSPGLKSLEYNPIANEIDLIEFQVYIPIKMEVYLLAIWPTTEFLEQQCKMKRKQVEQSDYDSLEITKAQVDKVKRLAVEIDIPSGVLVYAYGTRAKYVDGSFSNGYFTFEDFRHDLLFDYMGVIGSKFAYLIFTAQKKTIRIDSVDYTEDELNLFVSRLKNWIQLNNGTFPPNGETFPTWGGALTTKSNVTSTQSRTEPGQSSTTSTVVNLSPAYEH